jgi:hypothetical protein
LAIVLGVVFALAPWATFGLATPLAFAFATAVLRSRLLGLATAAYTAAFVVGLNLGPENGLYGWCIATNFLVGGVHAVVTSPRVIRKLSNVRREPAGEDLAVAIAAEERAAVAGDPNLRAVLRQRERRRIAREIVTADPALATELRIGRPDRGPGFDDGGLVDVNQVPASVLAALPGFDDTMAARVVSARQRIGGLRSGADLVVHADIPNEVAARLDDRLLFLD